MEIGTLYGIGVGPGDRGLMTAKAIEILKNIHIIIAPISKKGRDSLAYKIAKPYLKEEVEVVEMEFPMINLQSEKERLNKVWQENSLNIIELLKSGKNIAFLTLGDSMVYSTYSYLIPFLEERGVTPITIPGVTSFCASASALGIPIVQGKETFCTLTQITSLDELEKYMKLFDTIVIMKPSSSRETINEAIKTHNLYEKVFAISNCGHENEIQSKGLLSDDLSYFTIVIMKNVRDAI